MLKRMAILAVFLAVTQAPIPVTGEASDQRSNKGTEQQPQRQGGNSPSKATFDIHAQQDGGGNFQPKTQDRPQPNQQTTINITNTAPVSEAWPWRDVFTIGGNLILDVVGIAGTIIALWSLCTLKRQTKASWAAAKAALKQANHIVTSERSWMVANVEKLNVSHSQLRDMVRFSVRCVNKGKTPAFLLEIGNHGVVHPRDTILPAIQPPYGPENVERWEDKGLPLQPGADIVRNNYSTITICPEKIHTGQDELWIYGYIKYRDAFGVDRETWYCFLWDNNCSKSIEEDRLSCYMQRGPASYNRAT
jgi:hypothetical protein